MLGVSSGPNFLPLCINFTISLGFCIWRYTSKKTEIKRTLRIIVTLICLRTFNVFTLIVTVITELSLIVFLFKTALGLNVATTFVSSLIRKSWPPSAPSVSGIRAAVAAGTDLSSIVPSLICCFFASWKAGTDLSSTVPSLMRCLFASWNSSLERLQSKSTSSFVRLPSWCNSCISAISLSRLTTRLRMKVIVFPLLNLSLPFTDGWLFLLELEEFTTNPTSDASTAWGILTEVLIFWNSDKYFPTLRFVPVLWTWAVLQPLSRKTKE